MFSPPLQTLICFQTQFVVVFRKALTSIALNLLVPHEHKTIEPRSPCSWEVSQVKMYKQKCILNTNSDT